MPYVFCVFYGANGFNRESVELFFDLKESFLMAITSVAPTSRTWTKQEFPPYSKQQQIPGEKGKKTYWLFE